MEICIDSPTARAILEVARALPRGGDARLVVSLDLNLSRAAVEVRERSFLWGDVAIPVSGLERVARGERKAFRFAGEGENAEWEPLEVFLDRYYHIVPTAGSPTIEIDGIQMHRTAGVDPFEGAGEAARAVVRPGSRVFDTCGGLGYTAIHAARLGASDVISAEPSAGVLHLRRLNPWSRLETGLPITLHEEDAGACAARFAEGSFHAIIHDPPRFSLAPDLYSDAFYSRLVSLLAPGGRLFHYTGSPYSRGRGRDFLGGVMERLRAAGLDPEPRPDLQGFICTSARRGSPTRRSGPRGRRRS